MNAWSSEHSPVVHKECKEEGYCNICDGGLFICEYCNGAEGGLPTHCPRRKMTSEEHDAVYAGKLDFKDGEWWIK